MSPGNADGDVNDLIRRLATALANGSQLDFGGQSVPADLIRSALTGRRPSGSGSVIIPVDQIDPRGMNLTNTTVAGKLDLANTRINLPLTITKSLLLSGLSLDGAYLEHGLDLNRTTMPTLELSGAHIGGQLDLSGLKLTRTNEDGVSLAANNTHVDRDMFLDRGFTAVGTMSLQGAKIGGQLTLQDVKCGGFVHLPGAHIAKQLSLHGARLTGTNQNGISLVADSLQVDLDVFLDRGFTAAGGISLVHAKVGGRLSLRGAKLSDCEDNADSLFGDYMEIQGGADLDEGFTAAGVVRMNGAHIAGQLSLRGATLTGTRDGQNSLVADHLQVVGNVYLDHGFTAASAVHLANAQIIGELRMTDARLNGCDSLGDSLVADNLQVDGNVFLDSGFTASGAVRLDGAKVNGLLVLRGAILGQNKVRSSLVAENLQLDGSAYLDNGFTAAGVVRLLEARITGQLNMAGAELAGNDVYGNSLFGDRLQVTGGLFLNQGFTSVGVVRLLGAQTGVMNIQSKGIATGLVGSTGPVAGLTVVGSSAGELKLQLSGVSWWKGRRIVPNRRQKGLPAGRLLISLENCSYTNRPDADASGSLENWLRVLRFHTPGYEPRSYQQLAALHRATGHDRDASRILMAQQDHRRAVALRGPRGAPVVSRSSLWASRAGLAIWKATLGYGYRPRRALAWLAVLISIAAVLVGIATHWQADPAVPDVPVAHRPATDTTPIQYCSFGEATGLTLRIAIPLVTNLGQAACVLDTATPAGSAIVVAAVTLQTLAWILGALTIAAVATALRRSGG